MRRVMMMLLMIDNHNKTSKLVVNSQFDEFQITAYLFFSILSREPNISASKKLKNREIADMPFIIFALHIPRFCISELRNRLL